MTMHLSLRKWSYKVIPNEQGISELDFLPLFYFPSGSYVSKLAHT